MLGIFEIGSRKLFAPGWLRTVILLISVSPVARIVGMSHRRLVLRKQQRKKERLLSKEQQ
jgi:hypothetical protein